MFWIVFFFAAITLYRLLSRRVMTPKARVTGMLRRLRALERAGLTEQECLRQLLNTRSGWKSLRGGFLPELVSRLGSKEDVLRFVSVSEDFGYHRAHYPAIAAADDLETAMTKVACLFGNFGYRLQENGRFKEAEFVQKLAVKLQPDHYFTNLPLGATYCETGRYEDAMPLLERGLARLTDFDKDADKVPADFSPAKSFGADADAKKLRHRYKKMYDACLKATEGKSLAGFYFVLLMECFC